MSSLSVENYQVDDGDGNFINAKRIVSSDDDELELVPGFVLDVEKLKACREFNCGPNDCWLLAFPKCGTHWINEAIQMLRRREAKLTPEAKEVFMIDRLSSEELRSQSYPANKPLDQEMTFGGHIWNTHLLPKRAPVAIMDQPDVPLVIVVRDPRDVSVSYYNHIRNMAKYKYDGKLSNFLRVFAKGHVGYGSYLRWLELWSDALKERSNVFVTSYENMYEDFIGVLKQLCCLLRIPLEEVEHLLPEIEKECQFDNMRDHKEKSNDGDQTFKQGRVGMYRKGKTGDWKNWFSASDIEFFEQNVMKGFRNSKLLLPSWRQLFKL